MRNVIGHSEPAGRKRGLAIGIMMGAIALLLAVISRTASGWTYLAANSAVIVAAFVLGCVGPRRN